MDVAKNGKVMRTNPAYGLWLRDLTRRDGGSRKSSFEGHIYKNPYGSTQKRDPRTQRYRQAFISYPDYFGEGIRDTLFRINQQKDNRKVLIIGVGAGIIVKEILNEFPNIELYFINKEFISLSSGCITSSCLLRTSAQVRLKTKSWKNFWIILETYLLS